MSWIQTIDESEASGTLRKVYDRISDERGKVSNIMRIQSLNPAAMEAHLEATASRRPVSSRFPTTQSTPRQRAPSPGLPRSLERSDLGDLVLKRGG